MTCGKSKRLVKSQGGVHTLRNTYGQDDFYAIYDLNYFDTDAKKTQLRDKLFAIGFEN